MGLSDVKDDLYDLLVDCESSGAFATSGIYTEAPLPALLLSDFGSISLPLAERDAEAIFEQRKRIQNG